MLTVTHGNGWKDVDFEGFGVHWRAFDYAVGDTGPHYLMPSLIGIVENDGYYVDVLGMPDYNANLDTIKYPWKYADHEKVIPVLAWFIRQD